MGTDETQISPAKDISLRPVAGQIVGAAFVVRNNCAAPASILIV
jgi:hypothetical protein